MTDVFISYSRKDSDFVRMLHDQLAAQGRRAWVDWEKIPLTADWWAEIQKGIDNADTFVFVISPDSVTSPVCNREVQHAVAQHKRLVPIVRREVMPTEMHQALARHNWLFARDHDDFQQAFTSLMDAIDTDLDYVHQHTRLLVRAREWEAHQRDESYLLRGSDLATAEDWLAESGGKDPKPTELQTDYILSSRRATSGRQRALLAGVSIALLVTGVLALVALALFGVAENRRQESDLRGTAVAQNAATATHALGLSEQRGTAVAQSAATAIAAEATAERLAEEWRGQAWAIASERAADAGDHDAALALALQAMSIPNPLPEVRVQMLNAAYAPGTVWVRDGVHSSSIVTLDVSSDGRWLLSAAYDGTLALWEAESGALVRSQASAERTILNLGAGFVLNTGAVCAIDFHPARPSVAAIGYCNGTLHLFDVESWTTIAQRDDGALINALAFDPSGARLGIALARETENALVVSGESLDLLTLLSGGHTADVSTIAFSSDGAHILTGGEDSFASLWNTADGRLIRRFGPFDDAIVDEDSAVMGVAFGIPRDGEAIIIVATGDGRIYGLYEEDGSIAIPYSVSSTAATLSEIILSPDGTLLLSADYEGVGTIWDVRTGRQVRVLRPSTLIHSMISAVWSPDGRSVYAGFQNGSVRRWYARSGAEGARIAPFTDGATAAVMRAAPNFDRLLIGGGEHDPALVTWNPETNAVESRLEGHPDAVLSIDVLHTEDGRTLALTSGWDGEIRVWALEAGEVVHRHSVRALFVPIALFAGSPERALVGWYSAIPRRPTEVGMFDLTSGRMVETWSLDLGIVLGGTLNRDGTRALIGGADSNLVGAFYLVDVATGEVIRAWRDFDASAVQRVLFTPDETGALALTQDGAVIEWALDDGREVRRFVGHTDVVNGAAYSPDGRWLYTLSYDDTLRAWDARSGAQIMRIALGDDGRSVQVAPDGTVYTSHSDGSVVRWAFTPDAFAAVEWARASRYVRELTCLERALNRIPPLCE